MKSKDRSFLIILLIMISYLYPCLYNSYSKNLNQEKFDNIPYFPHSSALSFENVYTYEWNITWGGVEEDRGRNVIIDSNNNIYISGYSKFSGQFDAFLVKYDELGGQQWNVTWGGSNVENQMGIALDSSDNVYITGETFSYGNGGSDIFLIKYNEYGVQLWNRTWGYSDWERGYDVVIDSLDNIYVVGQTDIDLRPGYLHNSGVLIRYDLYGNQIWNLTLDDDKYGLLDSNFWSVTLDTEENIICAGDTSTGLPNEGDVLIVKFNGTGDDLWCTRYHYWLNDVAYGVISDSSNNIYITGHSGYSPYVGDTDAPLIKFNSSGYHQWTVIWDGIEYEYGCNLQLDYYESIYMVGSTSDYGAGGRDMFVAKYNVQGTQLWNTTWGALDYDGGFDIYFDSFDNMFVLGDTANYGAGDRDTCLVKYKNLAPSLKINSPNSQICTQKEPNFNITVTGSNIDDVWYTINGEQNKYGISNSNGTFFDSVDSSIWNQLQYGNVILTFYANTTDSYGAYRNVTIWKTGIPQIYNNIPDFIVNDGTIGYTLSWHVFDVDGNTDAYWIERNSTKIFEGTWTNDSDIMFVENNNLRAAIYNYTCFVVDSYGALNYSFIFVTILNTPPSLIRNQDDFAIRIGSTNFLLSWRVIDYDGNNQSYRITRNSVKIAEGSWTNDSDIIFIESEILDLGTYNYTCFVNDTALAVNQSSIIIVVTNDNPIIVNVVLNFSVNVGTTDFLLSWHAFDLDGNNQSYWIERNSFRIVEGTWQNNTDIVFIETEFLNSGLYNYTCFVNDSIGLMSQSSIYVKINMYPQYSDVLLPSINTYAPNAYYLFNCSWMDLDGIINEVMIEFDHQNYTVINSVNGEFSYNFYDLAANEIGYQFRWHARDNDEAWTSTDWYPFILNKRHVQLLILFNGTQENLIDSFNPIVNITILNLELILGNLQLFVDGDLKQQAVSYSLTNISQYLNGAYNITAILIGQNYTGYEMQWLNIQETSPPVILFTFSEYQIIPIIPEYYHNSLKINCTVIDSSPLNWVYLCENSTSIFLNRTLTKFENDEWGYDLDISHLNWNDVFYFYFYANDTWGNLGINNNFSSLYRVYIADYQNPISNIFYIPQNTPNLINSSTSFRITADDVGSGVSLIMYKINDSEWYPYFQPFNLSNYDPGIYEISYYSIDKAGNSEEINSIAILLIKSEESTPPTAIPSFNLEVLVLIISITATIILFKKRVQYTSPHT